MEKIIKKAGCFGIAFFCVVAFSSFAAGQSRDQNFPTSVTANEISGTIKARDMGDSRLTTYYYAFDGTQGDIFINVVSKNFTGDIDIFTRDNQRPLTKVVIYADSGLNETGRLIYLRKEENLLLRIQGRTPNDDAATFRIKFGGSFVALKARSDEIEPQIEPDSNRTGTVVNSVGTIIVDRRKSTPVKEITSIPQKSPSIKIPEKVTPVAVKKPETEAPKPAKKPEVVIGSTIKEPATIFRSSSEKPANPPAKVAVPGEKADPMAGIHLVILLKNGTQIVRPMTEVTKFSVDKGVLTVITTSGSTAKYSIIDVTRVTIE